MRSEKKIDRAVEFLRRYPTTPTRTVERKVGCSATTVRKSRKLLESEMSKMKRKSVPSVGVATASSFTNLAAVEIERPESVLENVAKNVAKDPMVSEGCTTGVTGTNINWMVTLGRSLQEDMVVADVKLLIEMGDDRLKRALAVIEAVRGRKK